MWMLVLIIFASLLVLLIGMTGSAIIVGQTVCVSHDAWAEEDLNGVMPALSSKGLSQEGEIPC
jgi:hypothetical protein